MLLRILHDDKERLIEVNPDMSADQLLMKALDLHQINSAEKDAYTLLSRGDKPIRYKEPILSQAKNGEILRLQRVDKLFHKKGQQ